jgi:F-type H+-transporting ATPase subunit a
MENPLHHFKVNPIHDLSFMGFFDISINNAVIAMWVGLSIMFGLFMLVVKSGVRIIPGKLQIVAEISLGFIMDMVKEFIGKKEAPKYFPFIATIFFFVLACNLVGMIPGSYTITSQLVVTGVFATFIFVLTLLIGFTKHGLHFFGILVPPGVPKIMIPIMIPIEVISMIARPVSLSVRLFANMTAGHTILYVLFGLAMSTPLMIGWLPFGFTIAINGLELAIAFIQAYIFTILTCVYIGDVIHLH